MGTNHLLNADGELDRWEIFAKTTTPVQLVIYRQEGGSFSVVSKSEVVTPKPGYNLFKLNPQIAVKAGDFVGAYYPPSVEHGLDSFQF